MSDVTVGNTLDETAQRDAIHVAIAPVSTREKLHPGDRVGFVEGVTNFVTIRTENLIGIVDPFLSRPVYPGDRFWLFLYPRTITSLRHDWTHPAFEPEQRSPSASEAWLRAFAERHDMTYNRLMEGAKEFLSRGNYLIGGAELEGTWVPEEFWPHFEAVTGTKVDEDNRRNFFSCAC
jgi:hypothetical protein